MPTVLVVDVSLSMTRPVAVSDTGESVSRHQLAVQGLGTLIGHLQVNSRLEFVSLIAFSSLYEVVCPFTRDFESVKSKLNNLEDFDKTDIQTALNGVNTLVLDEWGTGTPCQIVLVTDGSLGMGSTSLASCLAHSGARSSPLPFQFPAILNIMCLASPDEPGIIQVMPMYQRLIELAGGQGTLYMPDGPLSPKSVVTMFQRLADSQFSSFQGTLTCGHLSSSVVLAPTPQPYTNPTEPDASKRRISTQIEIVGFLDVSDVGSPMVISRHLVLPLNNGKENNVIGVKIESDSDEEIVTQDEGRTPSFCVLLHGALKVENFVALCTLGDAWYGMIYSWADTKKKSNIMLSIFQPGSNVIPWLGNLDNLGIPQGKETSDGLPVKPSDKRSYAQSYVVWIRQAGIQSDIQKILRHARKLPEKTPQFYKELNRVRRAALIFGFHDLLRGLSEILERECTVLPGGAHPDCALQLSHAANSLRSPLCYDMQNNIAPLKTRYGDA